MKGAVIEIVIGCKDDRVEVQKRRTWTLAQGFLSYHSGYFKGMLHHLVFKEATDGAVYIPDTDAYIFGLFVQWMLFGFYQDKDDLTNHDKVRDCARAWVLGDYLVAPAFKNFAMLQLYNIFHPKDGSAPKSGITPAAIQHCCDNSPMGSSLRKFFLHAMVAFWSDKSVVHYHERLRHKWQEVWAAHPDFSEALIFFLHSGKSATSVIGPFTNYTDRNAKRNGGSWREDEGAGTALLSA
jgi:hypothetical protein